MGGFTKSQGVWEGALTAPPKRKGVGVYKEHREQRTQPGPEGKKFNRPDPGDRVFGEEITWSRGDPASGALGPGDVRLRGRLQRWPQQTTEQPGLNSVTCFFGLADG